MRGHFDFFVYLYYDTYNEVASLKITNLGRVSDGNVYEFQSKTAMSDNTDSNRKEFKLNLIDIDGNVMCSTNFYPTADTFMPIQSDCLWQFLGISSITVNSTLVSYFVMLP